MTFEPAASAQRAWERIRDREGYPDTLAPSWFVQGYGAAWRDACKVFHVVGEEFEL